MTRQMEAGLKPMYICWTDFVLQIAAGCAPAGQPEGVMGQQQPCPVLQLPGQKLHAFGDLYCSLKPPEAGAGYCLEVSPLPLMLSSTCSTYVRPLCDALFHVSAACPGFIAYGQCCYISCLPACGEQGRAEGLVTLGRQIF